jgi:hypothetical protein
LPRHILDRKITELTAELPAGALRDVLEQLKSRPVFTEQWSDGEAAAQLKQARERMLKIEQLRGDTYTLGDILNQDPEIGAWYAALA